MVRSLSIGLILLLAASRAPARKGYYRYPAIHGERIVFAAEGDLWTVGVGGGLARRLTTHGGDESHPAISPDGKTLAFTAHYEGPAEVYTMPIEGGTPMRRTFESERSVAAGWTPGGKVLYATRHFSTLPGTQLVAIDLESGDLDRIELSQASEGGYDSDGKTLYFTRLHKQGSSTKRYRGGTAQNIWKFTQGEDEAIPLTTDYAGTSRWPMWREGRIYFASDRDGTMNLWSMDPEGMDLRQHTKHAGWDVQNPSLSGHRIVYQLGADLHIYDIRADSDAAVQIELASDFDQMRERWIDKPMDYLTAAHLSFKADRVALTARGLVFVAPVGQGRLIEAVRDPGVRYRHAVFMPDGQSILALSDRTGEVEFWRLPVRGRGEAKQLTDDGRVLRYAGHPSPDGSRIAYQDKNQRLWVYDIEEKRQTLVATSGQGRFGSMAWSPDGRWLAFSLEAANTYSQIKIHDAKKDETTPITSDRINSRDPAWSPDGKWLYFIAESNLNSLVRSPWGPRQPEPFFDKTDKIYIIALAGDERSPFVAGDELHPGEDHPEDEGEDASKEKKDKKKDSGKKIKVEIKFDGIRNRVMPVPVPAGNYSDLGVGKKKIFYLARERDSRGERTLIALPITNVKPEPKTLVEKIASYELSGDRKKILVRKKDDLYVIGASSSAPAKLTDHRVNLDGWTFPLNVREEWRQIFVDAWRLERDYFYDRDMHGVDWPAMRDKYLPLVDRVTNRGELSDLIAQMVGELSALHIVVRGGDHRSGKEKISIATLGARLRRDNAAGGWRIEHIYRADPDHPEDLSPLAQPGLAIAEGDMITAINGAPTLSVVHPNALLRNQAGKQVLLEIKPAGGKEKREVIVVPTTRDSDLRYDEWEYTRRQIVEDQAGGKIGYLHLRAMGGSDLGSWARQYYPVFNRPGLIIDVRNNRGGNIDSIILEKLLRKAWFYWQPRVGEPYWNMQYAFRGHVVVLCNENTASDGEAFTEGFQRLGLGKVIGTRTWGGEIWLSYNNYLVDSGIASAAQYGVYGPEGEWLIEGHGVDPDIVIDNPPHATFGGQDLQLATAINFLLDEIKTHPVPVPPPPPHPDKSVTY